MPHSYPFLACRAPPRCFGEWGCDDGGGQTVVQSYDGGLRVRQHGRRRPPHADPLTSSSCSSNLNTYQYPHPHRLRPDPLPSPRRRWRKTDSYTTGHGENVAAVAAEGMDYVDGSADDSGGVSFRQWRGGGGLRNWTRKVNVGRVHLPVVPPLCPRRRPILSLPPPPRFPAGRMWEKGTTSSTQSNWTVLNAFRIRTALRHSPLTTHEVDVTEGIVRRLRRVQPFPPTLQIWCTPPPAPARSILGMVARWPT